MHNYPPRSGCIWVFPIWTITVSFAGFENKGSLTPMPQSVKTTFTRLSHSLQFLKLLPSLCEKPCWSHGDTFWQDRVFLIECSFPIAYQLNTPAYRRKMSFCFVSHNKTEQEKKQRTTWKLLLDLLNTSVWGTLCCLWLILLYKPENVTDISYPCDYLIGLLMIQVFLF